MKLLETPEEKLEWKNKAVALIKEHLAKSVGWPQCSDEQIMEQLGPMWDLLVEADLIPEGATQRNWIASAQRAYANAQMAHMHKVMFF